MESFLQKKRFCIFTEQKYFIYANYSFWLDLSCGQKLADKLNFIFNKKLCCTNS